MTVPPQPERPNFATGYGVSAAPEGLLPWSWIEERLQASRNYWVGSTGPSGRPHATPVWGVWVDGAVHFGIDPASVKGRNLARNSRVVVHTESGDEPVIVNGTVVSVIDPALTAQVDEAYEAKYAMDLSGTPWLRVQAETVLAWKEADFPSTATRFRFSSAA